MEDAAAATRAIARRAELLDPQTATTAFVKADREGKVFVDSTRTGGATVVAAYSPRARPGVPVSFPVAWDELDDVDTGRLHDPHRRRTVGRSRPVGRVAARAPADPGRPDRRGPRDPRRPCRRDARGQAARPGPARRGAVRPGLAFCGGLGITSPLSRIDRRLESDNLAAVTPIHQPVTSNSVWVTVDAHRHNRPASPTRTVTPLAAARPGRELTFDAFGTADPHGWAVSHPAEAEPTAVNDPVVATAPGGAAAMSSILTGTVDGQPAADAAAGVEDASRLGGDERRAARPEPTLEVDDHTDTGRRVDADRATGRTDVRRSGDRLGRPVVDGRRLGHLVVARVHREVPPGVSGVGGEPDRDRVGGARYRHLPGRPGRDHLVDQSGRIDGHEPERTARCQVPRQIDDDVRGGRRVHAHRSPRADRHHRARGPILPGDDS